MTNASAVLYARHQLELKALYRKMMKYTVQHAMKRNLQRDAANAKKYVQTFKSLPNISPTSPHGLFKSPLRQINTPQLASRTLLIMGSLTQREKKEANICRTGGPSSSAVMLSIYAS